MREYNRFVSEIEPIMRSLGYTEEQIALQRESFWDDMQVAEYGNALEDVTEAAKEQSDIAKDLGMVFSSAFEDAVTGGKKFSEILKGLEQDIIRLVTRELVTEPFSKFVTGFAKDLFGGGSSGKVSGGGGGAMFSGLFDKVGGWIGDAVMSIFGARQGAAFAGGNVIPFARGGIVSRPTLFPMATGAGLMGEAGPEAVIPLKRHRGGNLGVAGGVNVNMTVYAQDASSFKASKSQIFGELHRAVSRGTRSV